MGWGAGVKKRYWASAVFLTGCNADLIHSKLDPPEALDECEARLVIEEVVQRSERAVARIRGRLECVGFAPDAPIDFDVAGRRYAVPEGGLHIEDGAWVHERRRAAFVDAGSRWCQQTVNGVPVDLEPEMSAVEQARAINEGLEGTSVRATVAPVAVSGTFLFWAGPFVLNDVAIDPEDHGGLEAAVAAHTPETGVRYLPETGLLYSEAGRVDVESRWRRVRGARVVLSSQEEIVVRCSGSVFAVGVAVPFRDVPPVAVESWGWGAMLDDERIDADRDASGAELAALLNELHGGPELAFSAAPNVWWTWPPARAIEGAVMNEVELPPLPAEPAELARVLQAHEAQTGVSVELRGANLRLASDGRNIRTEGLWGWPRGQRAPLVVWGEPDFLTWNRQAFGWGDRYPDIPGAWAVSIRPDGRFEFSLASTLPEGVFSVSVGPHELEAEL